MRILIVGSSSPGALELSYLKYLILLKLEVKIFDAQGIFLKFYNKNISNKILFRGGLSSIYRTINNELIKFIENSKPDIILVFKGMEVFPSSLHWVKTKGIKLVNYNPDNPFVFTGRGSGNKNVINSLKLFDLHLTYNLEILRIFEKLSINAKWLPFGYDVPPEVFQQIKLSEEIKKPCFIGTADRQRVDFFNKLSDEGVEIDVFGPHWQKFKLHKNISFHEAVYENEFLKKIRQYRVQINILRKHNYNSHGMRSFEIAAMGGIQLANDTPEHRSFFESDKEIYLFTSIQDCAKKACYLLTLSDSDADKIRDSARQRSVESNYSYADRANQLYQFLKLI